MAIICPKCQHENPDDTFYCGKCSSPLKSSEDIDVTATIEAPKEELTTGSTFAARYQIIEEIGKGGMGRVYKVQDTKVNEKIALKLIKPEIAKDKKTIERFSNELRLARKIRHKNVCQMFDLGEERGTQFITMEYVSGEDLRSSVRRFGQLPIAKSIAIATQICEGLSEAHRLDVVHRDLKSNNIMIDKQGDVRIMDFGIARSLAAKGITGAGVMIGTPEYMSPEQVEGKDVDQRSDIYSLGVILYEMVTGRVPFEGDTPFTVGVKQKSEAPPNPKDINSQIPDDLNKVILRCLEKEKEKRYQSAGEVRSELENIEKGIPTTERAIPDKKPLTSREITVTFSPKKLLIPALAVIAVIIAAIAIWQLFLPKKVVPLEYDKPVVAVMYFENNTGDENLNQYRKGISILLISDLMQSRLVNVVRADQLFNILKKLNLEEARSYSSEDLKKVAAEGRATHILQGNYTKAGENFRFDYTLHDVSTDEVIGSDRVSGVGIESMFSMVDELTRKIKADFKLSQQQIASDIDKDIGLINTNSPEALKYYTEGRKLHNEGDYKGSIELMQKAVAIDPEFAMAYRSLMVSYGNLGIFSESRKYREKALSLGDRLSDRVRYLIVGGIPALTKLLELYPEDTIGNGNLGLEYYLREEWDKAIERYEVCRENKFEFASGYTQLANSYAAKGSLDKAKEVLEDYITQISDHAEMHQSLAINYILRGKLDLANAEMDKAFSLDPTDWQNYLVKGDLYIFGEDFVRAEEEYSKAILTGEPLAIFYGIWRQYTLNILQGKYEKTLSIAEMALNRAKSSGEQEIILIFKTLLAWTHLMAGNPDAALKECEKEWNIEALDTRAISWKFRILEFKGYAFLEKGWIDDAQKTAEELKESIEKEKFKKLIRLYYHLMGKIEQKKGNLAKAIEYFEQAVSNNRFQWGGLLGNSNQAGFLNSLASAYYESGNIEEAEQEYQKILSLTVGRKDEGHIYAKAFYNLGKIYEDRRDAAKAIEHYEKFLELWKDADPGLPEVDDAKSRLASLTTL